MLWRFRKNNPEFRRGTETLKRQFLKMIESITDKNVIQGSSKSSATTTTPSSFTSSRPNPMKNLFSMLFK
jgi:hypothetical protein